MKTMLEIEIVRIEVVPEDLSRRKDHRWRPQDDVSSIVINLQTRIRIVHKTSGPARIGQNLTR
jgi:hypothetical protein